MKVRAEKEEEETAVQAAVAAPVAPAEIHMVAGVAAAVELARRAVPAELVASEPAEMVRAAMLPVQASTPRAIY